MPDRVAPAPSPELLPVLQRRSRDRIFRARPWVFVEEEPDPTLLPQVPEARQPLPMADSEPDGAGVPSERFGRDIFGYREEPQGQRWGETCSNCEHYQEGQQGPWCAFFARLNHEASEDFDLEDGVSPRGWCQAHEAAVEEAGQDALPEQYERQGEPLRYEVGSTGKWKRETTKVTARGGGRTVWINTSNPKDRRYQENEPGTGKQRREGEQAEHKQNAVDFGEQFLKETKASDVGQEHVDNLATALKGMTREQVAAWKKQYGLGCKLAGKKQELIDRIIKAAGEKAGLAGAEVSDDDMTINQLRQKYGVKGRSLKDVLAAVEQAKAAKSQQPEAAPSVEPAVPVVAPPTEPPSPSVQETAGQPGAPPSETPAVETENVPPQVGQVTGSETPGPQPGPGIAEEAPKSELKPAAETPAAARHRQRVAEGSENEYDRLSTLGEPGKHVYLDPIASGSEEEIQRRWKENKPLPIPGNDPEVAKRLGPAWDVVSRLWPEISGQLKNVRMATPDEAKKLHNSTCGIERATGDLVIPPNTAEVPADILWHELVHLEQLHRGELNKEPMYDAKGMTEHGRRMESEAHQRGNTQAAEMLKKLHGEPSPATEPVATEPAAEGWGSIGGSEEQSSAPPAVEQPAAAPTAPAAQPAGGPQEGQAWLSKGRDGWEAWAQDNVPGWDEMGPTERQRWVTDAYKQAQEAVPPKKPVSKPKPAVVSKPAAPKESTVPGEMTSTEAEWEKGIRAMPREVLAEHIRRVQKAAKAMERLGGEKKATSLLRRVGRMKEILAEKKQGQSVGATEAAGSQPGAEAGVKREPASQQPLGAARLADTMKAAWEALGGTDEDNPLYAAMMNNGLMPGDEGMVPSRDPDLLLREMAIGYDDATPEQREKLAPFLKQAGLKPVGEVGKTVPFDGRLHKTEDDVNPGDPVRVVGTGWDVPGGKRITRAMVVKAAPFSPSEHVQALEGAVRAHGGQHNIASYADVRKALSGLAREQQDAVLKEAHDRGIVSSSTLEGNRGAYSPERWSELQAAGMKRPNEPGTLGYLHLKQPQGGATQSAESTAPRAGEYTKVDLDAMPLERQRELAKSLGMKNAGRMSAKNLYDNLLARARQGEGLAATAASKPESAPTAPPAAVAGKKQPAYRVPDKIDVTVTPKGQEGIRSVFGDKVVPIKLLAAGSNASENAEVEVHKNGRYLSVVSREGSANKDGYKAERYFSRTPKGKIIAHNLYFQIGPKSPLKGKGAEIFNNQVESLRALGVAEIKTNAVGSFEGSMEGGMNGYYTWPRLGYDGPIGQYCKSTLPEPIRRAMGKSQSVLKLFSIPGGKEWWQLHGSRIDLKFDLSDGSESMKTLGKYMEERKSREPGPSSEKKPEWDGKEEWYDFIQQKMRPYMERRRKELETKIDEAVRTIT